MKKTFMIFALVLLVPAFIFSQGAKENPEAVLSQVEQPVAVDVGALKGPTAMGMVKLMQDASGGPVAGNDYTFTLEGAPDAITPKLVKGELDIAAVPANLAAVLYNNTKGNIEILAINTLGVLYIAENGDSVHSVEDLRGKTIYASGKGSTPEYALDYILDAYGLVDGKDVFVEWKSEHAECVASITAKSDSVAMLPQPFLTTAMMTDNDIRVALDLNSLWYDKMGSVLITGVVAARKDFVEENEAAVRSFLSEYEKSIEFTNEHPSEAAVLIVDAGIVPKTAIAEAAIPGCNITYIDGDEMAKALGNYFDVLYASNPKSVGGTIPDDAIYFK